MAPGAGAAGAAGVGGGAAELLERFIPDSTSIVNYLTIADYIASVSRSNIPQVQDEIVVEVVGQPGASKQELYFLALAAANGVLKRFQPLLQINPFLPPTASMIMIEYDASDHWVRCTMSYKMAAISGSIGIDTAVAAVTDIAEDVIESPFKFAKKVAAGPLVFAAGIGRKLGKALFDEMAVYRGPQCEVVGGQFDFIDGGDIKEIIAGNVITFAGLLPGIPTVANAPFLPWTGRTILTSCPQTISPTPIPAITNKPPSTPKKLPGGSIDSPNPTPIGDHRSRGAVVAKLGSEGEGEGVLRGGGQGARNPNAPAGPMGTWGPEGIGVGGGALDAAFNAAGPGHCCDKALLLEELVFASLTNPGSFSNETWTAPTQGPIGR